MRWPSYFVLAGFLGLYLLGFALAQQKSFVPVEGKNLTSKLNTAVSAGRSNPQQKPFWVGYSFDVRPGFVFDRVVNYPDGATAVSQAKSSGAQSRNLGVFLLYDAGDGSLERVTVFNLDKSRDYDGHTVYWLGHSDSRQSLELLKRLSETHSSNDLAENLTLAIALHKKPLAEAALEELLSRSPNDKTSAAAIFWLGQISGESRSLARAINEEASVEVRKQAALSIGMSQDPAAISTLQSLYQSTSDIRVKEQIITAAALNKNSDEAIKFLIETAKTEANRDIAKQALFWIGQAAAKQALEAQPKSAHSADAERAAREQSVFAIAQQPQDKAVPLLIEIARTSPSPSARKRAIFWLSQTGDDRALEFFIELLTK